MGLAENMIAQKMGEKRVQEFLKKNPSVAEKIEAAGITDTSNISNIDDLLKFTSSTSKLDANVAKQKENLAVSEVKLQNVIKNTETLQNEIENLTPEELATGKIAFDESGNASWTSGKTRAQRKEEKRVALETFGEKEKVKATVGTAEKQKTAKDIAFNNITKVTGGAAELVTTYADALAEGGMGNLKAAIKTKIAEVVGGDFAINFDDSLAWEGLKTEVVSAMMPLLTQQGDKPGSVRLVATIFDKLEKTIPTKHTPGFVGRNQIRKTLVNMGRRALAASLLGVTDAVLTEENKGEWAERIRKTAEQVSFKPEQQRELNRMMRVTMGPLDEYLADEIGGLLIYDGRDNAIIVTPESVQAAKESGDNSKLDIVVDMSHRDKFGNYRGLTPEESTRIIKRRKAKRRRK